MRHGIFLPPFHTLQQNATLGLQRDFELLQIMDALGFDEAWIGEHHSGGWEPISSPEIFIAGAVERTRRLEFGTGVISLPYHNPFNVANRIVQLDHQTRGRVKFGFGPGLLASDAHMLGVEPEQTRHRMAEAVDVIVRLLRGEVVTEKTEWYNLQEARLHLLPFTRPYPELAVASVLTPSGAQLAGKYDTSMLCMAAGEDAGFKVLDTNWAIAEKVAAEHGRTMDRSRVRIVMGMHLADTVEKARENVRFALRPFIDYVNNNLPRHTVPEGQDIVDWAVENKVGGAVIGTPDMVIERIEQVQEKMGGVGTVLINAFNWADHHETIRSMELYADYVIPHFENQKQARQDSYDWITEHRTGFSEKRVRAVEQAIASGRPESAGEGDGKPHFQQL
ncbi:LLM class flavin-dependent oxidoreductase [Nocardioides sp.]|uniref:LLM class flavin-dependent oxidoreductase n=1 Tax=Nocardioides sp. TaxID=35761 RepID=UPI003D132AD1